MSRWNRAVTMSDETGPCADALIAAGIARCVVAMTDPDDRVSGRGLARMREAGIVVETGVEEAAAQDLNRGFVLHRTEGRPLVTLKTATSLDGRIATVSGESKWITGPEARADAHLLRMTQDAVLVGIGTALADDPSLTCRLPGITRQPVRVVLDGKGRLPPDAALRDGAAPLLWVVGKGRDVGSSGGATVLEVSRDEMGALDARAVLSALADQGITRLMIEGGGDVAASFLREGLVDRAVWYRAAKVIGGDGVSAISPFADGALAERPTFRLIRSRTIGRDRVDAFERA
jgi:diaminohydroxyphosphoribosylaminopyrimidine deaminase/5-amino-6-(5-phosphoribosylamino)uracil reductase